MYRDAVLSPDGKYRYWLSRFWAGVLNPMVICMLNPSTADANEDDPTIRRCIGFAKRERNTGLIVVNLFALRATNPDELLNHPSPYGGLDQDYYMSMALRSCREKLVVAWGAHDTVPGTDRFGILDMALKYQVKAYCFGKTKRGFPKHPLYLKNNEPLIAF